MPRFACIACFFSLTLVLGSSTSAQMQMMGRVIAPRHVGAEAQLPPATGIIHDYFGPDHQALAPEIEPLTNVRVYASLVGTGSQALGFRTWSTHPVGWYRLTGPSGNYSLLYTGPAHLVRPTIFTNIFTQDGDSIDRQVVPRFDYAVFHTGHYDEKAASEYYQTFITQGTSITHVGFKLAHDGIDGIGPGCQTLLVSIHRKGSGTPDTWEQVGPALPVINVDSGGPKNYEWCVSWNSGEVPVKPGETYAVRLKAEKPDGVFQAFWRPDEDKTTDCYRLGREGPTGWVGRDLWMSVASDSDGLVIPYNKRIHREFSDFCGFATKWSQTYVAQGRALAAVGFYAATGGSQPGIQRQRLAVRVRQGGPDGPQVGIEKIAIGNGIHTGDASWGVFGAVFAPGEVLLEPGKTYALEFESIENHESLRGFVNIKGVPSDMKPGFNPYHQAPGDGYPRGTAYKNGKEDVGFDLDMQVVEYQHAASNWEQAVLDTNLLKNGDMEAGDLNVESPDQGTPQAWKTFATDPGTAQHYVTDEPENKNRILRVIGGSASGKTVDGGYVQLVEGLTHLETYRLSGRVRSSWQVDDAHQCFVGYDPTGQTDNPKAATIVWTPLPNIHAIWVSYRSDPIRPSGTSISVWLRGRTKMTTETPFRADFDDFSLQQVNTGVPMK